jgi:threonine dehydratase
MVSKRDIHHASEEISNIVKITPLLHSSIFSNISGNEVFLKSEHLQKTGSFKVRGAANRVLQAYKQGHKKIVAASSGNHGQAVAYIANYLGIESIIVVPEDIVKCKQDAIEAYNGRIEYCGTTSLERLERAKEICKELRAEYIPPYDDPAIIAGQGTVGLEIVDQLEDVEIVFVPIGGGGLISGVATAIKETNPSIKIVGVEPVSANDTYLSLQAGKRMPVIKNYTVADGLRTSIPGEMTFPIVQKYVDEIILVSEEEIKQAFTYVFTRMKQVIEPSGAVSVAAALFGDIKGKKVVSLVSGGNVDSEITSSLLVDL